MLEVVTQRSACKARRTRRSKWYDLGSTISTTVSAYVGRRNRCLINAHDVPGLPERPRKGSRCRGAPHESSCPTRRNAMAKRHSQTAVKQKPSLALLWPGMMVISDGCQGMQYLPGDVLTQITGLVDKRDVAQLAMTCKDFRDKLPQQQQREMHGRKILLRQSKRFLRHLPAIRALREFLHQKNYMFDLYPPQRELLYLAFGPKRRRQTDFSVIMNQRLSGDLAGSHFAITGVLTGWAEVSCGFFCA